LEPLTDPSSRSPAAATPAGGRRGTVMVVAALALALAVFLLYRVLSRYSLDDIEAAVAAIPMQRIALAGCFAAGSYLTLTLFDTLALRYVGRDLPYRRIALASLVSLSIGHSIGFAALSSGALRYRFYSGWGIGRGDVARIIVFCGITVGLGLATLAGVALLMHPALAARATGIPDGAVRAVAAFCFVVIAIYLGAACGTVRVIRVKHWRLPMPSPSLAAAQIVVGAANFTLVAATLHQVLSAAGDVDFFSVAAAYVVANLAALITHVPGGWGVLEAVVILLLPGIDPIGALIVYRVIYYLVPFAIGGGALAISELDRHRKGRRLHLHPADE
jgi:glycosyltransferase 2 family protein